MTLTQAAIFAKRLIFFTILSLVIGGTGFTSFKIWRIYNPPPQIIEEEKPTAQFGNLPLPKFPTSEISPSNYSYSIDTVDGNLPSFGKLVKVFVIPPSFATLLSPQKSNDLAEKLNLIPIPELISDNEYKFSNLDASMKINLDTGNFHYQRQSTLSADPITIDPEPQLIIDFKSLLAGIGYLKDELKEGPAKIVYLKEEGNGLKTTEIQNAQAVQISIWPINIDNKPIYTPSGEKSLINAVVSESAKDINNYISINFDFWPIDTATYQTYPIKTPYEALDDLKAGKGVIIKEPSKPQVSILNVHLGYYQTNEYVSYLQPIYLFEGPNFQAYVPAITNNYYDVTK